MAKEAIIGAGSTILVQALAVRNVSSAFVIALTDYE
jgi:hypothetical protein